MSYRASGYRGHPDRRSRSPPRFTDRRSSAANIFDARGPPRNASDAPRGPRSQFDGPPVRSSGVSPAGTPRTLRDAPPLGASRSAFRTERDFSERRERSPLPPRERSPARKFNDPRDFPPRDLDVRSARRTSRDGPLSAGSSYSDNPPFTPSSFRGGFARGRGRGDFFDNPSSRGGRRPVDDSRNDLFRRERSPPPRFGRDLSRDSRDADRRDDRRYERREDERRPEWLEREREREREPERPRREPPPPRLDSRPPNDPAPGVGAPLQSSQAPAINPERLAIIESGGADAAIRRPSSSQAAPPPVKREPAPEKPAYLNERVETTNNRYGSRGSSPPTQAPPVPAFSFSAASTSSNQPSAPSTKNASGLRASSIVEERVVEESRLATVEKSAPPANAPTAPKALPVAPKAHHASPPPTAPKAPRALEIEAGIPSSNRLYGVKSMESLSGTHRTDIATQQQSAMPSSPNASKQVLPHLVQSISPNPPSAPRFGDFSAPTGPKASRVSPAQVPLSPRPTFASPRSDAGAFQNPTAIPRAQTPPLSAPSGPRKRSFSVSPKVASSNIPTAPKAARGPPLAPRVGDRPLPSQHRPPERPSGMPPFAPSGPRSLQWNQWRRPGAPVYGGEKLGPSIPAKRDSNGEERERQTNAQPLTSEARLSSLETPIKAEEHERFGVHDYGPQSGDRHNDKMDLDTEPPKRKSTLPEGHSAAQSFFGKTLEKSEDEIASSSDDDELDDEEDATLLEAKHARREREVTSQMPDLQSQQYRSTSSLESMARVMRLVVSDLEALEGQHDDDMEVDNTLTDHNRLVTTGLNSSESDDGPDVITPRGEEATRVVIHEQEEAINSVRRPRRPTPEPISLPYLFKGDILPPLAQTDIFRSNIKMLEESELEVMAALEEELHAENEAEYETLADFADLYQLWRAECEDLDREKEEQEKLERQQSAEPNADFDVPLAPPNSSAFEGRRVLKYSSEYDMELVLKQSEETARIEQERQEREAKKKEADMEKEAILPDQQTEDVVARTVIIDANRFRDPESLTRVFSYEPPADTFSEKEQEIFVVAFKDTPKKWGEIASLLPGRTYRDCIHHYYANKWDGRFRDNRAKKFKGGRRGRGGKGSRPSRGSALMADLNRNEDLTTTANDSITGRPKRAAAPTTFGEREVESKSTLVGQSPAKRVGPGAKDASGEAGAEKPAKKPRRTGDSKPGRKGKAQLAALAAAPSMAHHKHFLPKDEMARVQTFEDANLLANFQGGQQGVLRPNDHVPFNQDGIIMGGTEDPNRPKPATAAKQSASSYWSVPEQTDFFKYIAHFGTDFHAIASHMGTKTHTMIKNHYQRQIEGGRADLEESAHQANARRDRGEDIGPPPEPTPIVKRKYDNPQTNTPRVIAPQTDAMEMDDPAAMAIHSSAPKHASPLQAQYQSKPRYTTSAQNTPIPATRMVPSPRLATTTAPSPIPAPLPPAAPPRGLQHPLGSRPGFISDSRAESHLGMQPSSTFRVSSDQPLHSRTQPPSLQTSRNLTNAPDPQLMHNLQQEQEKAMMRERAERDAKMRIEQQHYVRQPSVLTPHTHGSPAIQSIAAQMSDRKPTPDERGPTSPRNAFLTGSTTRPPMFASHAASTGPPLSVTPLASIQGRGHYHPSPPKLDGPRPGSVPTSATAQPLTVQSSASVASSAPAPTPAPDPPKRSKFSLMSILNDEPEETKPAPKRDSLPSASARVASPASMNFAQVSAMQGIPLPKREVFGQQTGSTTHFHRSLLRQQGSSPPVPPQASLKQEPPSGVASSTQQTSNSVWPPRSWGQGAQSSPPNNPMQVERDSRPSFYSHRSSLLSGLNQAARANPSPPPHPLHSRTPSLTPQQVAPSSREPRSVLGGPPLPATPHQSTQGLHSNPYAPPPQQPPQPFSQAPAQAHNRVQHSHNSSISERTSTLPPFGFHEEILRRDDDGAARAQQRERDQGWRDNAEALQRQRDWDAQQRRQEHEMERQRQQQAYARGQLHPQPIHGSGFSSAFGGNKLGVGPREQSARETDLMMRQEQRRMQEDDERQRAEQQQQQQQPPPQSFMRERESPMDPMRRRAEEPVFQRRPTPYGGSSSYVPPPPAPRR